MRSRGKQTGSTFILRSLFRPVSAPASVFAASTIHSSSESFTTPLQRNISLRPWKRLSKLFTLKQDLDNATARLSTEKEKSTPTTPKKTFVIADANLKPGYQILHQRFLQLINHVVVLSVAPLSLTSLWLFFTEQMLLESPVGMAVLAAGAVALTERAIQLRRANYFTHFSAMTAATDPSLDESENQQVRAIVAGTAEFNFTLSGLKVSGRPGDIENPSSTANDTLERIQELRRLVIPTFFLTPIGEKIVIPPHERWLTRFTLPFSIFNILGILIKNPKNRKPDDYAVLAMAMNNLSDFITGAPVGAARYKFTKTLHERTAEEVMQILIDNQILNEGGMSFLNKWMEYQKESISLRIGRSGALVLYPSSVRSFSIGGPLPIQKFSKGKKQLAAPEPETTSKRISRR